MKRTSKHTHYYETLHVKGKHVHFVKCNLLQMLTVKHFMKCKSYSSRTNCHSVAPLDIGEITFHVPTMQIPLRGQMRMLIKTFIHLL